MVDYHVLNAGWQSVLAGSVAEGGAGTNSASSLCDCTYGCGCDCNNSATLFEAVFATVGMTAEASESAGDAGGAMAIVA